VAKKKSKPEEPPIVPEPVDEDGFPLPQEPKAEKPAVAPVAPPPTPPQKETPSVAKAPTAAKAAPGEEMSKADAVRAAIAAGIEKPKDGVEYVKKEFGIEITPATFSVTKSQDAKKAREGGSEVAEKPTTTAKRGPKPKTAAPAAAAAPSTNGSTGGSLVQGLKALVERYGVEDVREVLELMRK
jgi:hypothetical protein